MFPFYKYHGLGNDFIIVEGGETSLAADEVIALCDRHRGVGADGVLVVQRCEEYDVPGVRMIIFNRDGGRSEMCGNGVRCVAAFARRHWDAGEELAVRSDVDHHLCHIKPGAGSVDTVTVDIGAVDACSQDRTLEVEGYRFHYVFVDTGNPHAVIFEEPDRARVKAVGELANDGHPSFPEGVNVEFAAPIDGDAGYRVVVYERGVGFTQACGTGACAVAEAAWTTGRVDRDKSIRIELPGGPLTIEFDDGTVWMTGMAQEVFAGRWTKG